MPSLLSITRETTNAVSINKTLITSITNISIIIIIIIIIKKSVITINIIIIENEIILITIYDKIKITATINKTMTRISLSIISIVTNNAILSPTQLSRINLSIFDGC